MSPRVGMSLDMILRAAAGIADEKGLNEVTLAAVAKSLNVKPPSLYNFVNGLQGIKTELAVSGLTMLYERMAASAEGLTGETALLGLADAYINFAEANPGLYDATFQKIKDGRIENLSSLLVELVVRQLTANGYAQSDTAIHAARGLRSLLHGFAVLRKQSAFELTESIKESRKFAVVAFLRGLQEREQ
ncbi:TetR/AcrR family transcriptional regulator [Bacillus velezensis]|uniref:TetR/AcrR family transcriptional regulator n=1 Tax=Bacillus velezensis TaxID=492670 RepID=UPI000E27BA75|nr:TetR-like C-terminal domain-containing protein [Bacillus velezensis]QHQ59064.1 TetR family transcriptional regulator [Bacillus velezensis]RDY87170.1 TetR family transcriptional regulator [Bacillus velezensis]